jgi:hypothetical protein
VLRWDPRPRPYSQVGKAYRGWVEQDVDITIVLADDQPPTGGALVLEAEDGTPFALAPMIQEGGRARIVKLIWDPKVGDLGAARAALRRAVGAAHRRSRPL